jgi:hypothetical protein
VLRNLPAIIRSALIGVGIGAVPGIGEDIAGWVSYGTAKNTSKHPETFGKGELKGVLASETANNACVGGAMIPLLNLGIPGSPPAAMLLGALMLHGVTPGPMITFEHPTFIFEVAAILLLASMAMWVAGMLLAKQVVKVLRIPTQIFMPIIGVLCIIGSYSLGLNIFNLYLMLPVGIISYFLIQMGYPIAPLVIGVILGPMADENLRRALMVSQGSFMPVFTRPVALILFSSLSGPSSASSNGTAKQRTGSWSDSARATCEAILDENEERQRKVVAGCVRQQAKNDGCGLRSQARRRRFMFKMAIITGFLSKTKDRFHEYNAHWRWMRSSPCWPISTGYDGVEIVYPYEVNDAAATRQTA